MKRKLKEKHHLRKTQHKNFKNGIQFKNYPTSMNTGVLNKWETEKSKKKLNKLKDD